MKNLNETFIIVKQFNGEFDFFQDFVSFDYNQIQKKCESLNKEENDIFANWHLKNGTKWEPIEIYKVLSLKDAINAVI